MMTTWNSSRNSSNSNSSYIKLQQQQPNNSTRGQQRQLRRQRKLRRIILYILAIIVVSVSILIQFRIHNGIIIFDDDKTSTTTITHTNDSFTAPSLSSSTSSTRTTTATGSSKSQQKQAEDVDVVKQHVITLRRTNDSHSKSTSSSSAGAGASATPTTSSSSSSSVVHCVGDNFLRPTSWLYKSCQFRNLCYQFGGGGGGGGGDNEQHDHDNNYGSSGGEFVVFQSSTQQQLQLTWYNNTTQDVVDDNNNNNHLYYGRFSTDHSNMVVSTMGSTTPMSTRKKKYAWSPKTIQIPPHDDVEYHVYDDYYELPNNVVWIPITFKYNNNSNNKSSSSNNYPMYLLMDTLLPVYNLLSMFGWTPNNQEQQQHHGSSKNDYLKKEKTMSIVITILNHKDSKSNNDGDEDHHDNDHNEIDICNNDCIEFAKKLFSTWMGGYVLVLLSVVVDDDDDDKGDFIHIHDNNKDDKNKGSSILILKKHNNRTTTTSTTAARNATQNDNTKKGRKLLCAKYGASGIGMLTDHGISSRHGQHIKDYSSSKIRNVGRGPIFYQFRNYLLDHILSRDSGSTTSTSSTTRTKPQQQSTKQYTITISMTTTNDLNKNGINGETLEKYLQRRLHGHSSSSSSSAASSCCNVRTVPTSMSSLIEKQLNPEVVVEYAISSNVWITTAGDGSWPGFFLPRGSTLILLYDETNQLKGGSSSNNKNNNNNNKRRPAMYHFDVWNHVSHLKVHWIAIQTIQNTLSEQHNNGDDHDAGISLLWDIIHHDLETSTYYHDNDVNDNDVGSGNSNDKTSLGQQKERKTNERIRQHQVVEGIGSVASFNGIEVRLMKAPTPIAGNADESSTSSSSSSVLSTATSTSLDNGGSSVHCVGENWDWDSSNYRSCHIQHLCLDISKRSFVMIPSHFQGTLNRTLSSKDKNNHPFDVIATNMDTSVMMGQSIRLGNGEPWFPQQTIPTPVGVKEASINLSSNHQGGYYYYYALPSNVVWMPYYAEQPNANNPGHLMWDYFLPIFNLASMFGLLDEKESYHNNNRQKDIRLFLTNLDKFCVSYAPNPCWNVTTKFLPLLGVDPSTFYNIYNPRLFLSNQPQLQQHLQSQPLTSNLICARHGAVGIGMLTDHGYKKHGQLIDDYRIVHNVGRGPTFWDFRSFMLKQIRDNVALHLTDGGQTKQEWPPLVITISINSSNNPTRRRDFSKQLNAIIAGLRSVDATSERDRVLIQTVVMGKLPLNEQLRIVQESAIFISVIGGAASTAMFLNRNSCLILYFDDLDDFVQGAPPGPRGLNSSSLQMPSMMDWDFWNHASYLRVHWLPIKTMDTEKGLNVLVKLIHNEIDIFSRL